MTIFRVNYEKDQPIVLRQLRDPAVARLNKQWQDEFADFAALVTKIELSGSKLVRASRAVYGAADTKLKDPGVSKEDKEELLKLRKRSYDFTNSLKSMGVG